MALINRITRLFRADVHAVLDRLEEPDILLQQAIREMDDDLQKNRQHLKQLERDRQQQCGRIEDLQNTLHNLDDELNVCFASQQESLARNLVKRKLESQRHLKRLSAIRQELDNAIEELSTRIASHQARLENMRQKAEMFGRDNAIPPVTDHWEEPSCTVTDDEVEVAFLKEKQHRSAS